MNEGKENPPVEKEGAVQQLLDKLDFLDRDLTESAITMARRGVGRAKIEWLRKAIAELRAKLITLAKIQIKESNKPIKQYENMIIKLEDQMEELYGDQPKTATIDFGRYNKERGEIKIGEDALSLAVPGLGKPELVKDSEESDYLFRWAPDRAFSISVRGHYLDAVFIDRKKRASYRFRLNKNDLSKMSERINDFAQSLAPVKTAVDTATSAAADTSARQTGFPPEHSEYINNLIKERTRPELESPQEWKESTVKAAEAVLNEATAFLKKLGAQSASQIDEEAGDWLEEARELIKAIRKANRRLEIESKEKKFYHAIAQAMKIVIKKI